MFQRCPVKVLHYDERLAVLLPNVVDSADIRMVERRGSSRFTAESLQRLPVLRHILRQELQCNETVKASVLGLVHDAHASAAELLDDAVMRDDLANHSFSPRCAEILRAVMGQVNNLNRARCFGLAHLRQNSMWHVLLGGAAVHRYDNWQIF